MRGQFAVPDHVPAELVFDFDMWAMPDEYESPITYWRSLRERGAPRICYTPHHGGHWIIHEYEDVMETFKSFEAFSSFPQGVPARPGGAEKLVPVELDPPEHTKYRNLLAPAFSPAAVKKMQVYIRTRMRELMANIPAGGGIHDFVEVISGKLPTSIFIDLMGMDNGDFDNIMKHEEDFMHGATVADQARGAAGILDYVTRFIDAEAKNPRDNIAGLMLQARNEDGTLWDRSEIYNTTFLLYTAGLDTVMSMMTYIWHRLATDEPTRLYVAANIGKIDQYADELMRLHGPSFHVRRARQDITWRGVFMRAGDAAICAPMLANRDASFYTNPDDFDPARANARHQAGFGAGPHRCIGSHLARQEIIIALEEWFARFPEFTLVPGAKLLAHTGNVSGIGALPLVLPPG